MAKKGTLSIEDLRKRTAAGKRRISKKKTAERRRLKREDEKLQKDTERRAEELFEGCKRESAKAADRGESKIEIWVISNEKIKYRAKALHVADFTTRLLKKEGFTVETKESKTNPRGFDPLYPWTVYSVYLIVSWE